MARPRKIKIINFEPDVKYFKPRAVPVNQLEEVIITIDELETLRLSNMERLSQADAAKKMDVHQSTFHRTLDRARQKVTDALVNGIAIRIQGGEYKMPRGDGTGPTGQGPILGRGGRHGAGQGGLGRMGGPLAAGVGGTCVCPSCGHETTHIRGQPCNKRKCPKCGNVMTRN